MSSGPSVTLLQGLAAKADRFGKAPGEIIGNCESIVKNRVLWILRAHADRLLQMSDGLFRSACERECAAEIAMSRSEVRVEVECALEFFLRRIGAPRGEGQIAEREM